MKLKAHQPKTITIQVPLRFTTRGNTKRIIGPVGPPPRVETALVKALAKAHRWRQRIEAGEFASITELAKTEKVNQSYACRVLRLTLLSPQVVTAILNGRLNPAPTVNELMKPVSALWAQQERQLGIK